MGSRRPIVPLLLSVLLVAAVTVTGAALTLSTRADSGSGQGATVPAGLPVVPGQVHFTSSGDFTGNTNAIAGFESIAALQPDFHLAVGDLSYGASGQEQTWCDLVKSRVGQSFPFELVAGNHESNGVNGNINDFSACLANQLPGLVGTYGREWYVDFPQENPLVRIVMISPNLPFPGGTWNYTIGNPHYNWTAAAIDGAHTANIPWVVVGMHKPCLSIGVYSCEPGADIMNLLVSKKVDLVLNGHEHIYQRTHQLGTTTGCPSITPGVFNGACVIDSDSAMVKGAGTVFATVGTGGQVMRPITANDTETGYFAQSAGSTTNATYGALDVILTPTTMTANFVRSAGGTMTDSFTMGPAGPPANVPPVGVFTTSCTILICNFDATGSTDSDGTIEGYQWDFGDSSVGAGAMSSHVYGASGTYPISLSVTDDDGAVTVKTDSVSVGTPPPNEPPVAAFTSSCVNVVCTLDASSSTDTDGTITSFEWNFGDSTATATGATVTHSFAAAGTYQVTLTATDDDGAPGALTKPVTVTAAPGALASDQFTRTVANGFGTANVGGPWTVTGAASQYSVGSGSGQIRINKGTLCTATLAQVNSANSVLTFNASVDKLSTGSGLYVYGSVRKIVGIGSYRGRVKFASNGQVAISLARVSAAGVESLIQSELIIAGLTYAVGDQLSIKVQATGAAPTLLSAKVWKVGTTEPATWQRSATDSTSGFQVAGSVEIASYLSSSATGPIVIGIDDLTTVVP